MKTSAVKIFIAAHVMSSIPHVTRSAMRSVSDVTRDIIQPTGVLSKYEKDSACRWSNIFLRRSYCTRWPSSPAK